MRSATDIADRCAGHVEDLDDAPARKYAGCSDSVQVLVGKHHVAEEVGVGDALLAQRAIGCAKATDVLHKDRRAIARAAVYAVLVGSLDGGEMRLGLV